jgi:hypothetical protein
MPPVFTRQHPWLHPRQRRSSPSRRCRANLFDEAQRGSDKFNGAGGWHYTNLYTVYIYIQYIIRWCGIYKIIYLLVVCYHVLAKGFWYDSDTESSAHVRNMKRTTWKRNTQKWLNKYTVTRNEQHIRASEMHMFIQRHSRQCAFPRTENWARGNKHESDRIRYMWSHMYIYNWQKNKREQRTWEENMFCTTSRVIRAK